MKPFKRICKLVVLFTFISFSVSGQVLNTDSLKNIGLNAGNDTLQRSHAFYKLFQYYMSCNHDSAFKYAQLRFNLFDTLSSSVEFADACLYLGVAYSNFCNLSLTEYYVKKAIDLYRDAGDLKGEAFAYNNMGYIHLLNKQYDKAGGEFESCARLLKALNMEKGEVYTNIGIVYSQKGETKKSIENYFLAKSVFEKEGNKKEMIGLDIKIAGEYASVKDFEKAKDIFTAALKQATERGMKDQMALAYGNLGEICLIQEQLGPAKDNFDNAYRIFKEMKALAYMATTNYNRAYLSFRLKDYEAMKSEIKEGLDLALQFSDTIGGMKYKLIEAKYYVKKGLYEKALSICHDVEPVLMKTKLYEVIRDEKEILFMAYKGNGEPDKAIGALEKYYQYKDSTFNAERIEELARVQSKYEYDKEKEIIEIQNRTTKRVLRTWIIFIAILLLVALAVLSLFWKWNVIRKKMNLKLGERNKLIEMQRKELKIQLEVVQKSEKEKETLLKEIHHRVKNNLQVISSLLELQVLGNRDGNNVMDFITESQNRVRTMGLIHQMLYQSEDIRVVDLLEFSRKLIDELGQVYGISVRKTLLFESNHFDIDTAILIGLILNELISNSFKYGQKENAELELNINLEPDDNDGFMLTVHDNGPGLNIDFESMNTNSLGLHLVKSLSKQLLGKCVYTYNDGACFSISFASKDIRNAS